MQQEVETEGERSRKWAKTKKKKNNHSPHNEAVDVVVPVHVPELEVSAGWKTHMWSKANLSPSSPPPLDYYASTLMGLVRESGTILSRGNRNDDVSVAPGFFPHLWKLIYFRNKARGRIQFVSECAAPHGAGLSAGRLEERGKPSTGRLITPACTCAGFMENLSSSRLTCPLGVPRYCGHYESITNPVDGI